MGFFDGAPTAGTATGPTADDLETGAHVGVRRVNTGNNSKDSRPLIFLPDAQPGDKPVAYSRASGLGKILENDRGLWEWKLRATAWGLSRRPDLINGLSAIRTIGSADTEATKADRAQIAVFVERAMETARTSAGATSGTALHVLSEQYEQGVDLSHLPDQMKLALEAYRRLLHGVRMWLSERFVVHDEHRAGGSFDRLGSLPYVFETHTGDRITPEHRCVIDLKSNKSRDYWGAVYLAQQATYQGGRLYRVVRRPDAPPGLDPFTCSLEEYAECFMGVREDWPDGIAPHPQWALIPHVPVVDPSAATWVVVNLETGRMAAAEAARRRDWKLPGKRDNARRGFTDTNLAPVDPTQALPAPPLMFPELANAAANLAAMGSPAAAPEQPAPAPPAEQVPAQPAPEPPAQQPPAAAAVGLPPAGPVCPLHGPLAAGTADCFECLFSMPPVPPGQPRRSLEQAIRSAGWPRPDGTVVMTDLEAALHAEWEANKQLWTEAHSLAATRRIAELTGTPTPQGAVA